MVNPCLRFGQPLPSWIVGVCGDRGAQVSSTKVSALGRPPRLLCLSAVPPSDSLPTRRPVPLRWKTSTESRPALSRTYLPIGHRCLCSPRARSRRTHPIPVGSDTDIASSIGVDVRRFGDVLPVRVSDLLDRVYASEVSPVAHPLPGCLRHLGIRYVLSHRLQVLPYGSVHESH